MKKWVLLLLLGTALLFSGCTGELVGELYVQDIIDAVELREPVFSIGTVAIESPGAEQMESVIEFFNLFFREPTSFREQTRDMSTYMLADVRLPVVDVLR